MKSRRALYHGTDKNIDILKAGSYVTTGERDAQKFGFRRAVVNGSPFVYVYRIIGDPSVTPDPIRDRAFILQEDAEATLTSTFETYATPFKLKKFKKKLVTWRK